MPPKLLAAAAQPAPLPLKFPRRRCDNCGEFYPLTKPNRRFCKTECKKEFHQHGAAFGPLKARIEKMIRKEVAGQVGIEVGRAIAREINAELLARAGFVHSSQLRSLFKRVAQLEAFAGTKMGNYILEYSGHSSPRTKRNAPNNISAATTRWRVNGSR